MKRVLYLGFAVLLMTACSSETASTEQNGNSETTEMVEVTPNKVMKMEIEGMVCKMGCGGSIRKELKASEGVSQVEFDFEEERESNTATIYFDSKKITEKKIIEIVSALNNKQFSVGLTSTEDFKSTETRESANNSSSSDIQIEATSGGIEVPNLLELLARLIVG